MTTSNDFDFFLRNGFINGLNPGSPMRLLLSEFGDNYWYVKERESNGLIYGIIKIGFIEFHVRDEKINGISYRPGIPFSRKDFNSKSIPWIAANREVTKIKEILSGKNIGFKAITVHGPLNAFKTAGALWGGLEKEEYTYIDTAGGVTFAFEENKKTGMLEANQICKYYDGEYY